MLTPTIDKFKECMKDIKSWMFKNKLQLNESKTESLLIGKPSHKKKCPQFDFEINDNIISTSSRAKNLGVIIDDTMSMNDQVDSLCKSLYYEIHRINLVRKFLTPEVTRKLMVSLVLSKLDYCNSLLSGLPQYQIQKLQRVQNWAARIIFRCKKSDHVTPLLRTLYWLPVSQRIDFKIALLVFKCINGLAPQYLTELIRPVTKSRILRSSNDTTLLHIPFTSFKTYGDRSF